MNKLLLWLCNSTLAIALVYLISIYFKMGGEGAFANTLIAVLLFWVYAVTRALVVAEFIPIVLTGLTTLSAMSLACTGLAFPSVLQGSGRTASYEWELVRGFIAASLVVIAFRLTTKLSMRTALTMGIRRAHALTVFYAQAVLLHLVFRYGAPIVARLAGS